MATVNATPDTLSLGKDETGIVEMFDPKKVYATKYVSVNPLISDWQPSAEFTTEETADQSLGITEDHGFLIKKTWKKRGTVALHNGMEISEENAERVEEATGRPLGRYNAYDCYVSELVKTDGPERRRRLQRTYEQQKEEDQATMYRQFGDMIQGLVGMIKGNGTPNAAQSTNITESLKHIYRQNPDQFNALVDQVKDMAESETVSEASKPRFSGKSR